MSSKKTDHNPHGEKKEQLKPTAERKRGDNGRLLQSYPPTKSLSREERRKITKAMWAQKNRPYLNQRQNEINRAKAYEKKLIECRDIVAQDEDLLDEKERKKFFEAKEFLHAHKVKEVERKVEEDIASYQES